MFDPTRASYGVIVLMTGNFQDAGWLAAQTIQLYQPVFDRIIARATTHLYAGHWESEDKKSKAVTYVHKGSVWLRKLVLDGEDMFKVLARYSRVPQIGKTHYGLWSTGRKDEFRFVPKPCLPWVVPLLRGNRRIAVGLAEPHDYPLEGCEPAWVSLDGAFGQVAPIDLVLFDGDSASNRTLHVPSAGVALKRKSRH